MKYSHHIFLIFYFLFLGNCALFAQEYQIKGKVTDVDSREPLAFVNIIITGTNIGTSTDINGEFSVSANLPIVSLSLSYVGYRRTDFMIPSNQKRVLIPLKKEIYTLKEVEIMAGENPAIPIIKRVSKKRKYNNPIDFTRFAQPLFEGYHYDSEEIVDHNKDSVADFDRFLESVEVFLMQSIQERDFYVSKDTSVRINTSRYVGFQNQSFIQEATEMSAFNIYEDKLIIGTESYLSPISRRGITRYYYVMGDTLYEEGDSVFVILFRQIIRSKRENEGISGLLYIGKERHNLKNVIINFSEELMNKRIKIVQKFQMFERGKEGFKHVRSKVSTNIMMWFQ